MLQNIAYLYSIAHDKPFGEAGCSKRVLGLFGDYILYLQDALLFFMGLDQQEERREQLQCLTNVLCNIQHKVLEETLNTELIWYALSPR